MKWAGPVPRNQAKGKIQDGRQRSTTKKNKKYFSHFFEILISHPSNMRCASDFVGGPHPPFCFCLNKDLGQKRLHSIHKTGR